MATEVERLVYQMEANFSRFEKNFKKAESIANRQMGKIDKTIKSSSLQSQQAVENMAKNINTAIATIGLTLAIDQSIDLADEWKNIQNQINAAAEASSSMAIPASVLVDLALDTNTALSSTADLYTRVNRSVDATVQSQLAFVRAMNQAAVASGQTNTEIASTVTQLSQALQAGVLQGDEYKSIRENAPLVIAAIAEEMQVTKGALKDLASEGKITSDIIFSSVLNFSDEIEAQFAQITPTLEIGLANLQTAATEYAGTVDQALGTTNALGGLATTVANDIELFGDALLVAVTVLGATGLGHALSAAGSKFSEFAMKRHQAAIQSIDASKMEAAAALQAAKQADLQQEKTLKQLQKATSVRRELYQKDIVDNQKYVDAKVKAVLADDRFKTARLEVNEAVRKGALSAKEAKERIRDLALTEQEAVDARARARGVSEQYTSAIIRENEAKIRSAETTRSLNLATQNWVKTNRLGAVALRNLRKAGSAVMSLFGGPLGLAITGAGLAMAYFNQQSIKAQRQTDSVNQALSILAQQSVETADGQNLSAEASEQLTKRLEAQKKATESLARLEKQRNKIALETGAKNAQIQLAEQESQIRKQEKLVERLNAKLEGADSAIAVTAYYADLQLAEAELESLQATLDDTRFTAELFSEAMENIESLDLNGSSFSSSGKIQTQGIKSEGNVSNSLRQLENDYRSLFETEREEIRRTRDEHLAAIEEAKLSDEERQNKRLMAEQIYAQKIDELDKQAQESAKEKVGVLLEELGTRRELLEQKEIEDALEIARASGNEDIVQALEDQLDLRQRIAEYMELGLNLAEATARAEEQQKQVKSFEKTVSEAQSAFRQSFKNGFKEAIESGDVGSALKGVLADALTRAWDDALDVISDALFNIMSSIFTSTAASNAGGGFLANFGTALIGGSGSGVASSGGGSGIASKSLGASSVSSKVGVNGLSVSSVSKPIQAAPISVTYAPVTTNHLEGGSQEQMETLIAMQAEREADFAKRLPALVENAYIDGKKSRRI